MKIIWWYIAEVEDWVSGGIGEEKVIPEFFNNKDTVEKLTFQGNREILKRAVELVEKNRFKRA